MRKVVITGGRGFLGWHLRVRLRALYQQSVTVVDHADIADPQRLRQTLLDADTLVHLAGVNRADNESVAEHGNVELASALADAMLANAHPIHVVYSNSIQAGNDTPYGRGKQRAAERLRVAAADTGSTLADVLLPNLFGEHGKPHYNSFVATFCHELATGRAPVIRQDRTIPLLHAQRAADVLIEAMLCRDTRQVRPDAPHKSVTKVLELLRKFQAVYASGQIPDLTDDFNVDLFNTFRGYYFPQYFPVSAKVSADRRGELFECVRSHSGTGQTFVSSTVPGQSRGDHYHLRKIERFFVLRGEAEICLRRVLDEEVVRFRVNGEDRAFVDMPTMWAHNIRNVGQEDLLTLFWSDQLLDREAPDTYREAVDIAAEAAS